MDKNPEQPGQDFLHHLEEVLGKWGAYKLPEKFGGGEEEADVKRFSAVHPTSSGRRGQNIFIQGPILFLCIPICVAVLTFSLM